MDILYLHPAKQEANARFDKYKASSPYPFIPVGVIGLLNLLRSEGWQVEGFNLSMTLTMYSGFNLLRWLASKPRPKLVMIDLHWYEHAFGALDVAQTVKRVWPTVPIVLGGLTASNFAEEILENFPTVDFIIKGDAEKPLRLLAAHCCGEGTPALASIPNLVYRAAGTIHQTTHAYFATPEDLDALDFVTLDWLHHADSYSALQYSGTGLLRLHDPNLKSHWLCIGRGCVFNCTYCGGGKASHNTLAGRNGYVVRRPERVVDDIERLVAQGFQQVALSLDPATFGPEWWRPFFSQLRSRHLTIGIYNEFFQLPSVEFLDALAASANVQHTEVAISPLSGDEAVRRQNGKFYTNERFLAMLERLAAHEIPIFIYFSLNLPGETPQTFKQTLHLADAIGKQYPSHLLRMLNPCHTLDPVSPMSRQPAAFGLQVHYQTFMDYYTYCKGTAWLPRHVTRGEHRGYEMIGRPAATVEQMAQIWDIFAKQQKFRCFPVPSGW
ncbi:MAG TPA: radical SAM protein [Caldilineaceae bacterium]|nr:radical SAM protein [Caldilineaceae bacterium]